MKKKWNENKRKMEKKWKNVYIVRRGRITSQPSSDWFNSYNLIG